MREQHKLILREWDRASDGLLSPIHDADLARLTKTPPFDLRNHLESMEHEGLVERVRVENPDGFNVLITALGRIELSKLRLSQDQSGQKGVEPTAIKSRAEGSSVIRCRGQGLLPRIASRSSPWRRAPRIRPLLEGSDRRDGPGQDLPGGLHLRPERLRQVVPGQSRFAPSSVQAHHPHLHRGDGRGDRSPTAQRIAEALPRPARRPRSPHRSGRCEGENPGGIEQDPARDRPVRAVVSCERSRTGDGTRQGFI